ncbi:hydrolase [Cryptosporangium japonicum]|uniref:Platelet-activating factor acetylhydrolase n=1 Tax=Cryptosporangium japonicum TaxID=80872 RepID=A0ABP3DCH6_9ACTN
MTTRLLAGLAALALITVGATAPPEPAGATAPSEPAGATARSEPAGATAPARFTLPAPTGPYEVGTAALHLVDASRADPWVPTDRSRDLIVQLWYPTSHARGYPAAPWLTPAAARAYERSNQLPTFRWPITAGHRGAPVAPAPHGWPVLLYSHGLGGHRGEATALVQGLAGEGYLVVTIDHVHDARVVEMPDGHVETSALPELTPANELAVTTRAIEARVADTRFVLDQLAALDRGIVPGGVALPRGLRGAFDERAIGMLGHSDGGATTAAAMRADRRIAAGVNLDGTLWTAAAQQGSDRPMLLFGRAGHDRTTDPTWARFWARQRGPKLQLNLAGSGHGAHLQHRPERLPNYPEVTALR